MGFALAMQLLRHREDAADAVQDSLQRLVQKRRTFDPQRGHPRAWFLKIVRNRCLDVLRRRSRRRCDPLEPRAVAAPLEQRPDLTAEKREILEIVRQQLMALPDEQREIILLRDFHNLSYAEIDQTLKLRPSAVLNALKYF